MYDKTSEDSFNHVDEWLQEVDRYAHEQSVKLLVGNKSDLESQSAVDYETAKRKADQLGVKYVETSAKSALNVDLAFMSLTKELLDRRKDGSLPSASLNNPALKVNPGSQQLKSGNCC